VSHIFNMKFQSKSI